MPLDDMKIMVKIIAAIKACEGKPFNVAMVHEKVLHATETERDINALRLQKAGYVEGLRVIDGIDGQTVPQIMWEHSSPVLTFEGVQMLSENKAFHKAAQEIKDVAIQMAAQTVSNVILTQFPSHE